MLFLVTCMLGGFVIASLTRNDDDDDGPDNGLLSPIVEGI